MDEREKKRRQAHIGAPVVGDTPPPRSEGTIPLPDGRELGYAEFGEPLGPLVLWCHGSPGARTQIPPVARRAADQRGLRIVCVERPGIGASTDHTYRQVRDWADDVAVAADHFGQERFLVVGLSGGGPYALATGHELPERVVAVGILGGVVPTCGDDAAAGGVVSLTRPFNRVITAFRRPLGRGLWAFVRAGQPVAGPMYNAFATVMPDGDTKVFRDPAMQEMFIQDLTRGGRKQFQAFVNDVVLMGRPWGFNLADVRVPVRWWHGDADPFVSLEGAQRVCKILPNCELRTRHGESHMGGFAASDRMLASLQRLWETSHHA